MPQDSSFKRLNTRVQSTVEVWLEGQPLRVPAGDSAAAAVLAGGLTPTRTTPVSGNPRAPYCMMGVCFECLLEIDGVANRQGCMTPVREGMRIRRQQGARALAAADDSPVAAGSIAPEEMYQPGPASSAASEQRGRQVADQPSENVSEAAS